MPEANNLLTNQEIEILLEEYFEWESEQEITFPAHLESSEVVLERIRGKQTLESASAVDHFSSADSNTAVSK